MKYGPKRRKQTGRFDFTATDPAIGKTVPFGYCMEYFKKGNEGGHHATPEESVKCFLRFVCDVGMKYEGVLIMLQPCAICGAKTMRCATYMGEPLFILCSEHCSNKSVWDNIDRLVSFQVNPDLVENINPYVVDMFVAAEKITPVQG